MSGDRDDAPRYTPPRPSRTERTLRAVFIAAVIVTQRVILGAGWVADKRKPRRRNAR